MNYPMIRYVLAWVLRVEGLLLFLPCLIALIYQENTGFVYLVFALIAFAAGSIGCRRKPASMEIYQKEGFVSVGLAWLLLSLYGALPFFVTREIPSYFNGVFEIVSGFTTTGASILTDVESLTHTTLLWRSLSHWIGGMGVLVFILMLFPGKRGSHVNLMRAESPGPEVSKFVPRVRKTAHLLYRMYVILTLAEIGALLISGMHWFDSICITFGTAGTGGFGVLNASCGAYTPLQQWIITAFMISFGVNFTFYYLVICRKPKDAVKMGEVRAYLLIILAAGLLITWNIRGMYPSFGDTIRNAFFQVGSIMTTTGFSTTDFNVWPALSKVVLVGLMFIGACAGSTGGGMKVSRFIVMLKSIKQELFTIVHPRSIRRVRMDGQAIQEQTLRSVHAFLIAYFVIFGISLLLVSFDEFSFETNFTAVAATLNNIGPGLSGVGPTANYASFGLLSKGVLIFDMLAGRLELFPILVLFYPGTWKKH